MEACGYDFRWSWWARLLYLTMKNDWRILERNQKNLEVKLRWSIETGQLRYETFSKKNMCQIVIVLLIAINIFEWISTTLSTHSLVTGYPSLPNPKHSCWKLGESLNSPSTKTTKKKHVDCMSHDRTTESLRFENASKMNFIWFYEFMVYFQFMSLSWFKIFPTYKIAHLIRVDDSNLPSTTTAGPLETRRLRSACGQCDAAKIARSTQGGEWDPRRLEMDTRIQETNRKRTDTNISYQTYRFREVRKIIIPQNVPSKGRIC